MDVAGHWAERIAQRLLLRKPALLPKSEWLTLTCRHCYEKANIHGPVNRRVEFAADSVSRGEEDLAHAADVYPAIAGSMLAGKEYWQRMTEFKSGLPLQAMST